MRQLDTRETKELEDAGQLRIREIDSEIHSCRIHSWHWCEKGFEETAEWLLNHPHEIRRGVYLSNTPNKEVWRLSVPARCGGHEVVLKTYLENQDFLNSFMPSIARNEVKNYAVVSRLGIPAARVIACGEERAWGRVKKSYIVTKYVPGTIDGTALMPGGSLWENRTLCRQFCYKAADILARMHQCHFYHRDFQPDKILFRENYAEADLQVMLIDITSARFRSFLDSDRKLLARDILTLVSALRLSTHEIQDLCNHYLEINRSCGYSPESLWQALTAL